MQPSSRLPNILIFARHVFPCATPFFVLFAVLLAISPVARALDPAITLDGYRHERWGELEGAPRFIDTLAQTDDGWLWVASRHAGLFRFDGVRFHPFDTADGSKLQNPGITVLRPARDGALWIGHGRGGVTVLRDGRYRHLLAPDETGAVFAIALDSDGIAWVAGARGLYRIAGDRIERIGAERGYPAARAEYVLADGAGRLWVADGAALYLLAPGATAFERVRPARTDPMLIEAGDGSIWLVLGKQFERVAPPAARKVPALPGRTSSFQSVFDRDGNLWSGNCPVGVCVLRERHWRNGARFTPVGAAERLDQPWQMTSLSVMSLMEDRDGSLWIGTPAGLERLRDQPVHMVPELFDRGKSHAALAPDGSIYTVQVRKFDDTTSLSRIAGGRIAALPDPLAARALSRGPDGTLVLAGERGIALLGPGGTRSVPCHPACRERTACASPACAPAGGNSGCGPCGKAPGTTATGNGPRRPRSATNHQRPSRSMPPAAAITAARQPAAHRRRHRGARIWATDGLAVGRFHYIHPDDPLLVAGEEGTQVLAGGRFHTLRFDVPGGVGTVSGLAAGPGGTRWLNTERGILRVQSSDWARALADPRSDVRGRLFDSLDGYVGGGETTVLTDTAFAARDGKLWFAGERGLAWVDPARIPAATAMPDVEVLAVTAGGRRHRPGMPLQLPKGTEDVQVDYSVPALRMPQRVTFRYRLAGDAAWQDAGARRTAYFQRLSPGEHAFDVMAIDENGVASRVTTLRFHIAPTPTQTWWFWALVLCAGLAAAALAYRLRTRRLAARIEERLLVRVRERESIARALHDTFLQSVQGMLLSMHAATVKLPADSPVRAEFERVLRRAEDVMVEGRDEVRGLRGEFGSAGDFWQALLRDVELTVPGGMERVRLVTPEAVARLQPNLYRDVHAIAREALTNALRHTTGQVALQADANTRAFELSVTDAGGGLGPFADGKPGHFGLPGMRERAAQIGARLQIDGGADGTRVHLAIPAGRAYAPAPDGSVAAAAP